MKSAEDFLNLLDRGFNGTRALRALAQCELQYIAKVPTGIYLAAACLGWRFFPLRRIRCSTVYQSQIRQATSNLDQLKQWAPNSSQWALATGARSGVLVLAVDGDRGRDSLLDLCDDDWDWLFTLRTQAGSKRYIFFAWPQDRRQIPGRNDVGEGLSLLGEGDWLLFPPSREPGGIQHVFLTRSTADQAPVWLLNRAFYPELTLESVLPPPNGEQAMPRQVFGRGEHADGSIASFNL